MADCEMKIFFALNLAFNGVVSPSHTRYNLHI